MVLKKGPLWSISKPACSPTEHSLLHFEGIKFSSYLSKNDLVTIFREDDSWWTIVVRFDVQLELLMIWVWTFTFLTNIFNLRFFNIIIRLKNYAKSSFDPAKQRWHGVNWEYFANRAKKHFRIFSKFSIVSFEFLMKFKRVLILSFESVLKHFGVILEHYVKHQLLNPLQKTL